MYHYQEVNYIRDCIPLALHLVQVELHLPTRAACTTLQCIFFIYFCAISILSGGPGLQIIFSAKIFESGCLPILGVRVEKLIFLRNMHLFVKFREKGDCTFGIMKIIHNDLSHHFTIVYCCVWSDVPLLSFDLRQQGFQPTQDSLHFDYKCAGSHLHTDRDDIKVNSHPCI